MTDPLPYLETTDPAYGEQAASSFAVEEVTPGALRVCGPCPRCGDPIEVPVVTRVYRGRRRAAGETMSVPIDCTCEGHDHPGRPDGRAGCGAYWNLTLRGEPR